jgi:hypothetical protein
MKKQITHGALLCLLCLNASAANIICSRDAYGTTLTQQSTPSKKIIFRTQSDICENGYQLIRDTKDKDEATILLSPTELGANAKYSVYHASFSTGEAEQIGELPASAYIDESGAATNIHQEGGSIYMEKYKINRHNIEIMPTTLELVVDGSLCLDNMSNVWPLEIHNDKSCSKRVKASFSHPMCIRHEEPNHRLQPKSACNEIEKFRPK